MDTFKGIDRYIFKFSTYISFIIPAALISGPFLSDTIIVLISLFFLYLSIKYKKLSYFKNKFFIFFIIWCIYILFSSLLSENIYLSLESSLFYLRFGFYALAIWFLIDFYEDYKKYFFYSLLIPFLILLFDAPYQYFFEYNILGFEKYNHSRVSSLFREELVLGSFLSRLLPLIVGLYILLFKPSFYNSLFLTILLVLFIIVIFISGERTAFFYLLMNLTIFLIYLRSRLFVFLSSIIFSILMIFLISKFDSTASDRLVNYTFKQVIPENNIQIFSTQHQTLYVSSLKMFADYPFIGIGPKMFREMCQKEKYKTKSKYDLGYKSCQTSPHNFFIQILTETGIFGFIFIFSALLFILRIFIRQFYSLYFKKIRKYSDYQICLFTCILISLFPLVPAGNFFNNWLSIIIYLPIGFLFNSLKNDSNES